MHMMCVGRGVSGSELVVSRSLMCMFREWRSWQQMFCQGMAPAVRSGHEFILSLPQLLIKIKVRFKAMGSVRLVARRRVGE